MDADDKQNFEEELNLTLEPILTNVISVHNQLFGSSNLVLSVSCLLHFTLKYASVLLFELKVKFVTNVCFSFRMADSIHQMLRGCFHLPTAIH